MQAYSVLLVTQHIEQLRADAAESRRYRRATPSLRVRATRTLSAIRAAVGSTRTPHSSSSAA